MFRSIVVPLDGSAYVEQSLPLALGLARKGGATLHLVRVHGLYALEDPKYGWLPYDPVLDKQYAEQELAYLDEVAQRVSQNCPLAMTSTVMNGVVADGILTHAHSNTADLIVMTTHGRGSLSRAFLGSVADELVRRVATPVLVVRPREIHAGNLDVAEVRQVLVAVDPSPLSEQILQPVLALGRATGAAITLLHVLGSSWHHGAGPPSALGAGLTHEEQHAEEALAYLQGLAAKLATHGLEVRPQLVRGHHAASSIIEESAKGYDVVALTTHGRGGVQRLLLGSVADKVVRGASIPVLVHCPVCEASPGGPGQ
jgi:nucleotide-binding universal stress UspA family protein